MSYWVRWAQDARDELTECYLAADPALQELIGTAAFQMEQELRLNPLDVGESRSGDQRIDFEYPLAFLFHVDLDDETVSIVNVWTYKKRGH
jgi:hypothetical protein